MAKMILGVFSERGPAEHAVEELSDRGYEAKDISIVMKDKETAQDIHESTGAHIAGGALSGATTGGVLGGIAGLLIGIGAITIPGVGAILIGGPLAAALGLTGAAASTVSGAVTGALAGGLVGSLVGLGVPEEEARHYESRISEGGILVAVPFRADEKEEAKVVLEDHGADMIRVIDMGEPGRGRMRSEEYSERYFR